jgi:hypothetical protein
MFWGRNNYKPQSDHKGKEQGYLQNKLGIKILLYRY